MEGRPTAIVATNIAMTGHYLPYERPPDVLSLWTAIPRGLRSFFVDGGELDLKPVNDSQLLTLSATLPANFAYVLQGVTLSIAQNKAGLWNTTYSLNLQNYFLGQVGLSSTFILDWPTIGNGSLVTGAPAEGRADGVHGSDSLPSFPFVAPRGTSGILISIQAQTVDTTAATAGVVNSYINFWEFDLEQVRKYPINSPLPVHAR